MSKLDEIMQVFGAEIGVSDFAADQDGTYYLTVDDMRVSVMEVAESGQVAFWSQVGDLPSEGQDSFCRQMLEAMSPADGADGAVLSICPESKSVCLHRVEALESLGLASFKAALDEFVTVLEQWRTRLADFRPQVETVGGEAGFLRV